MSPLARVTLTLTLLFASAAAFAASAAETGTRLLTRAEGASLVRRVLDYSLGGRTPDCSHLMHQSLTAAGVNYPYATSFKIYGGIPQFRRVRNPQAGDLIVWPGHVGLVVDAKQQKFYSSTGSGVRVVEYSSDYWRSRGTPRFYRYLVTSQTSSAIGRSLRAGAGRDRSSVDSVVAGSAASSAQSRLAAADGPELSASYEIPESIQIVTEHDKPTKGDIEEALAELSNASAPALEDGDRDNTLLLVAELKVIKVQTAGERGWAEVRTNSAIELEPDGVWKKVRLQKQRWELRRGQQGWIVFTPPDRIYVSQKVAIPLLASQLSAESRAADAIGAPAQSENLAGLLTMLRRQKLKNE